MRFFYCGRERDSNLQSLRFWPIWPEKSFILFPNSFKFGKPEEQSFMLSLLVNIFHWMITLTSDLYEVLCDFCYMKQLTTYLITSCKSIKVSYKIFDCKFFHDWIANLSGINLLKLADHTVWNPCACAGWGSYTCINLIPLKNSSFWQRLRSCHQSLIFFYVLSFLHLYTYNTFSTFSIFLSIYYTFSIFCTPFNI